MSLFQVDKPKNAGKVMIGPSKYLERIVLDTLKHIAHMAGATLGPGGRQVLIERPEVGMKPIVTKDGVTVIKHLGYKDATAQLILEAARDAAIRTAAEAGDGTTTSAILSSSIADATANVVRVNKKLSPQKIVREMEKLIPFIEQAVYKHKLEINTDNYAEILTKVATLSANGDSELAKTVIEAFDTVGEEGNLTIVELTGKSRYEIERLNGYTIDQGYEESCRNFANGFINDKSGTLVTLNKPIFILFDGVINDLYSMYDVFNKMNSYLEQSHQLDRGVVLIAHGFSDSVLGEFHLNWNTPGTIKILPLLTPQAAIMNWRTHFLYDLQAYLNIPVFNPIDRPMKDMDFGDLCSKCMAKSVEVGRFRSTVVAHEDVESIAIRVDELKEQRSKAESEYELKDIEVRIGKLTAGIARLNIYGLSQGETREKRDRAEDAWMAIRGAIKYGACPGGGYVLINLSSELSVLAENNKQDTALYFAASILAEAFIEPIRILYRNYGYVKEEIDQQIISLFNKIEQTYDIEQQKWVDKFDLLDSIPAVLEAIRNSISIASLLGTIGGIVSFSRSQNADDMEQKSVRDYEENVELGEQIERERTV